MGAAAGDLSFGLSSNAVIGRPFIVATQVTYVNSGNSLNVNIPNGVIAGDIIFYVGAHTGQVNLPANHTMLTISSNSTVMTGTNFQGRSFFKIAAGTEGGTTQAVTFTTTSFGAVAVHIIRGGYAVGYSQVRASSTSAGSTTTSTTPAATAPAIRDNLVIHTALIRAAGATVRSNNGNLVLSQTDTSVATSIYQGVATSTSQGGSWTPSIATSGIYAITTTWRPLLKATGASHVGPFSRVVSVGSLIGPGATAGGLLDAPAGSTVIGGDVVVYGTTAAITVSAGAGTGSITQYGVEASGITATIEVQARAGTPQLGGGSSVPGDFFASPIELNGLSGSFNADLLNSTVETAEPDSDLITHSVWVALRPDVAGSFTITSGHTGSFNHSIELFDGDSFADLELLAFADWTGTGSAASISYQVGENGPYWVRLTPYNIAAGGNASIPFTWAITQRVAELTQEIRTPVLDETPSAVFVSILNAQPFESVSFSLNGTVLFTEDADASGVIQGINVPIPELAAGTYTLVAKGLASNRTDSDSFQVTTTAPPAPTPPPADGPPVAVPQVGVRKWVLQDPVAGGTSYTFTYNPSEMKPIFAPRFIDVEHTTSPQGIPILWEGVRKAHEWEFSGYLDEQADMLALTAFYNLNHRFFLIDHRNRAWIVVFEGLDLQPKRNNEKPYAHNYTVKALIFGEHVQL